MDQDKLFVISTIDRAGIAEELNVYREDPDNQISANDPRLTDEFCQKIADKLHELDRGNDDNPLVEEYLEETATKLV